MLGSGVLTRVAPSGDCSPREQRNFLLRTSHVLHGNNLFRIYSGGLWEGFTRPQCRLNWYKILCLILLFTLIEIKPRPCVEAQVVHEGGDNRWQD
jgi:hypothetical protein